MYRSINSIIPAVIVSALLAGCDSNPEMEAASVAEFEAAPVVDLEAEEQAIRELDRQWVAAVAASDAEATADFYAPDGRIMPPNAPAAQGHDAVAGVWRGIFGLPNGSLTFAPTAIEVTPSGEMAYDVGTYLLSFDGPAGRVEDEGKYLVVWKKVGGEWKIAGDMFNSNLPAAG